MARVAQYFGAVVAEAYEAMKLRYDEVFAIEYGACLTAEFAVET